MIMPPGNVVAILSVKPCYPYLVAEMQECDRISLGMEREETEK